MLAGALPTVGAASCSNTTVRVTVSLAAIRGKEKLGFLSQLTHRRDILFLHQVKAKGLLGNCWFSSGSFIRRWRETVQQ